MTKRFTAQVPTNILYAIDWHNPATYAEVFDYFADKGLLIVIDRGYSFVSEGFEDYYEFAIEPLTTTKGGSHGEGDTWIECANEAILVAIDLI